jgi:hypothetical protein
MDYYCNHAKPHPAGYCWMADECDASTGPWGEWRSVLAQVMYAADVQVKHMNDPNNWARVHDHVKSCSVWIRDKLFATGWLMDEDFEMLMRKNKYVLELLSK